MELPILVTRPYFPPKERYDRLTDEIWKNRWLTNRGALHNRLQRALSAYLGLDSVQLTVNGHMALDVAVKTLGLTGEVVTTPFTFASTTHALVQNGLTPVFCDIDDDSMTIDPGEIERRITDDTSAILAVHVYGRPCDVDAIEAIAKRHGLKVLYDAAHAFGVRLNGRSIAAYGDVSAFSFHATKLFHTIEGGMLYAEDPALMQSFALAVNFGIEDEVTVPRTGGNAKMNEMQAAMGLLVLEELESLIAERRALVARYRERLDGVPGLRLCIPEESRAFRYNYAYLPVRVLPGCRISRDALYAGLQGKGIYARRYFYPLTSALDCYQGRFSPAETPVAQAVSEQILALPLYNGLSLEAVDYVAACVRACLEGV